MYIATLISSCGTGKMWWDFMKSTNIMRDFVAKNLVFEDNGNTKHI